MKKSLFVLPLLILLAAHRALGFQFEGPFQVKNQFPIFLPVNQPYLEKATTEDSLSFSLSHSSVFVMADAPAWSAHMDLELTEFVVRARKNLGLLELGVDVPVVRATAGFLDRPLEAYHSAFGFPDYGRHTRPYNEFLYDIRKDGRPVIEGDNDRTGFGDVRISAKKNFFHGDRIDAGVLADLELPTGNARVGYGNGSFDSAFAVLLDWQMAERARLYTNLGVVFPGELKAFQTVRLHTFEYGGAGIEYFLRPSLSLLGQFVAQTSPYPETGISQIDTPGMLLVLGGRYHFSSGGIELSLTEDPNTSGAPDFILNLTYKAKF